jgi:hypothetical protein
VPEEQREEVFVSGWPEECPFQVERAWISGWDFTVMSDDALAGERDRELDELREYLAAPEGITETLHEDREVLHVRAGDLNLSEVAEKARDAAERTGIDG